MEFRPGTCSACKASFRIPASFTANQAKCSKCGGTVEIGPVTSDSAPPEKSAAPTQPAKAISAPVAGAAARLAAKPESTATPPVPAKPLPVRQPAVAAAPPKPPTVPVVKPAALAAKPAAAPKPAAKAAPVAAVRAKPSSSRGTVVETADDENRAGRRKHLEKKKGPSPLLVGGALVLFAIVGAGLYVAYGKQQQQNAEKNEKLAAAAKDKAAAELAKATADEAEALKVAETEKAVKTAEKAAKASKGEVLAAESGAGASIASATTPVKPAPSTKPVEGYDLSTIPDFGPLEGTAPEAWTELQTLAATYIDLSAGARSSKAGVKLELTPKPSFPAILNQFKKLNFETEDGFRAGDMTQKMLERICHGNNFTWRYQQDKDYVKWNQMVVKKWCDAWAKASTDEAYWNKLTKNGGAGDTDPAADGAPVKKIDDF